jgi:hypothetical protein
VFLTIDSSFFFHEVKIWFSGLSTMFKYLASWLFHNACIFIFQVDVVLWFVKTWINSNAFIGRKLIVTHLFYEICSHLIKFEWRRNKPRSMIRNNMLGKCLKYFQPCPKSLWFCNFILNLGNYNELHNQPFRIVLDFCLPWDKLKTFTKVWDIYYKSICQNLETSIEILI